VNNIEEINWSKSALIPAIIQEEATKEVLMLGYMNQAAVKQTIDTGTVTFFSRSKNRLWTKGETSGNKLLLKSIELDCDQDTLLINARPLGPTCHQGTESCFGPRDSYPRTMERLEKTIASRKFQPKENSYTSSLFAKGLDRIAQKVGEEAVEVVIASKNSDDQKFREECADLLYHLTVLLVQKGSSWKEIYEVLEARRASP
jgi:phosphoribosyl-ATP pyrophosphohydrolase/phosphoribosyl-AMP cyclohydrolase